MKHTQTALTHFINAALDKKIINSDDKDLLMGLITQKVSVAEVENVAYGSPGSLRLGPHIIIYNLLIKVCCGKEIECDIYEFLSRYIDYCIPNEYGMKEMQGYCPGVIKYSSGQIELLEEAIELTVSRSHITPDEATLLRDIIHNQKESHNWDVRKLSNTANTIYTAIVAPIYGNDEFISKIDAVYKETFKESVIDTKKIQGMPMTVGIAKSTIKSMAHEILSDHYKNKVIDFEGIEFYAGLVHRLATIAEEVLLIDQQHGDDEDIAVINDYVRRLLVGYSLCILLIDNNIKQEDEQSLDDFLMCSTIDPFDMVYILISKISAVLYLIFENRIDECLHRFK